MKQTLAGNRKLLVWVTFGGVLFVGATFMAAVALRTGVTNQEKVNRQVCVGFNNLNKVITASLKRSQVNLPKLSYFQEHPAELAAQQQQIQEQLADFKPRRC